MIRRPRHCSELLGSDPSVGELRPIIAERAAGNPFFAEEMVRELAERGVLPETAAPMSVDADVAEVSVPATVQATIAARIDRLERAGQAHVERGVGDRIALRAPTCSTALGIDPVFDELLEAELIDQVRFTPSAEYAFRHPLIRAVAYESQLKSDRAELHRRLAAAIEQRDPGNRPTRMRR